MSEETKKKEQCNFTVMDMRIYNIDYHKDQQLVWKKIVGRKRKKTYPLIEIKKVKVEDDFVVRQDILEQSREQFNQSGKLIPVLLSPDNVILNGYEQFLLAKELKHERIAFYSLRMSKSEKRQRHRLKGKKRR